MAATVTTSAWSKPGAWALDSEQHEDELKQPETTTSEMSDFPDLITAAATKTKKKKGQTLSLNEFVYQPAEDMMMLPTGPRQRTAEELDRSRLGGGFRSYGDRNNESLNSRWSNKGDDGGRREPLGPSRADESDDWGAVKKPTFGRRERGFGEGLHSRADESESWNANKSYKPVESRKFGNERRIGFESSGDVDSSDNWGRKKEVEGRRFGAFNSLRDRRVGSENMDSDNWGRKREEVSGGGGGGRPRLNLQPRKVPVGEVETVKVTKGVSLFGDARPREEVLKQKGEDWKEIDEKLEAMKMKDLGSGSGSGSGSGDRFRRGNGNGKVRSVEDSSDKNWRKNRDDVDVAPPSENSENGHTEEPEPEQEAQK